MIGNILALVVIAIAAVNACPYSSTSYPLGEIDYYPSIPSYGLNYIDDISYLSPIGASIPPASYFQNYEPVYTFSSIPAPLPGPIALPALPAPSCLSAPIPSPAYFSAPVPALPAPSCLSASIPSPAYFPAPLPALPAPSCLSASIPSPAYFPAPLPSPIALPALPGFPAPSCFPAPLPSPICYPSAF